MSKTEHYWKKKAVHGPLSAEYSSETDEIQVSIEHRIVRGDLIFTDHFRIDPSAIEPLYKILKDVTEAAPKASNPKEEEAE